MRKSLKWLILGFVILAIASYLFLTSGMGKVATDLTQAYTDPLLYENAIQKANANQQVLQNIGEIQPIDKMRILNGEVSFSDNNNTVNSTIKINGVKGNGKMDITARREKEIWIYTQITIRIQHPENMQKVIEIVDLP